MAEHQPGLARADGDGPAVGVPLEDFKLRADWQAHADDPVLKLSTAT